MVVTIPLVLLLGLVVLLAWRYMGLRAWQAALCLAVGFLLAATTAAPQIRAFLAAVARWLGGAHP